MQRTNTFEVRPLSEQDRVLLLELLDASAACYNEVNYQRRQAYFQAQSEHEGASRSVSSKPSSATRRPRNGLWWTSGPVEVGTGLDPDDARELAGRLLVAAEAAEGKFDD